MKLKQIILVISICLFIQSALCQTNETNLGTVTLAADTIEADSAMATHPVLYSNVMAAETVAPDLTSAIGVNDIKFYSKPQKGTVRLKFKHLPVGVNPQLELWNSQGNIIKQIQATKTMNIINLRTFPAGTYTLKATLNNEVYSWEIIKE